MYVFTEVNISSGVRGIPNTMVLLRGGERSAGSWAGIQVGSMGIFVMRGILDVMSVWVVCIERVYVKM